MFSFFVSGEASLVFVSFFTLTTCPGLCAWCMHAANMLYQVSAVREYTFTVSASNRKARFLMDFLMVSL